MFLFQTLLASGGFALEADPGWHVEPGGRWRELAIPKEGKAGFVRLDPTATGIQFTNLLDDASGAANRVLENGSGVAIGDFDADGRPDIFLCSLQGKSALYRNLGNWQFENVTAARGLSITNFVCRGAVFADVNGDGWLDLLISTLGHGVLVFLNDGTGNFTNATPSARTETSYGSMTMTLADVDGNGTLDLYVANYRTSDIRDRSRIEVRWVNGRMEIAPQLRDRLFLAREGLMEFGEPDVLYLNDGHGHFNEVSWTSGRFLDETGTPLTAGPKDWGLSATFRDLNGDGAPDLYVCNDYWTPDRIWLNDGSGVFRAVARLAVRHTSENSMGVDFADILRDGHTDIFVLDMLSRSAVTRQHQMAAQTRIAQVPAVGEIANRPQVMRNTLLHGRGDGTFAEIADFAGVSASDWSWQPVFLDVDLDGYEDLIISAGHRRDVQDLDANAKIMSLQHPWPKEMDSQTRQEAFTREMIEHSRLYPTLDLPIVAYRNRGNLTFEDVTAAWGTSELAVHQGIAIGDFDGDGDLDFVVNNLNGAAGVYRNESNAPRVAVRLRGLSPNTQGIGAAIKLYGGAVPMQSQEMICGGRYLSGDEAVRVFAAGSSTNEMRLEVTWRSGKWTIATGVRANRLYEIDELAAKPKAVTPPPQLAPVFEDVSSLLGHTHHDEAYNDWERQPLLPRKLSQLGPGLAWMDLDGDGWEDLVIGGGKGGAPAFYRNSGTGAFQALNPRLDPLADDQTAVIAWPVSATRQVPVFAQASYETNTPSTGGIGMYDHGDHAARHWAAAWGSSTGPLAAADIDGSGHLTLFAGGRVVPGRYPEPATSRFFTNNGSGLQVALERKDLGLVSGAVWSDLNGDGYPELILACEWGPLRLFHNTRGKLDDWDPPLVATSTGGTTQVSKLSELTGWWNGVATADLDGDGRMDIIASNWGKNTKYERARAKPLRVYFGDFNLDQSVGVLESFYATELEHYVPWRRLDQVVASLPWVRGRFSSHAQYSLAGIPEVLGDRIDRAQYLEARTLESMVLLNRGDHFEIIPLPAEAQFSPAFGICVADFDGDGNEDLFLSQNFFDLDADTPRLDAGRGLWLRGDGKGHLAPVPAQESGVQVYGEQRGCAICDYDGDGRADLAVAQNGGETKLYHNTRGKPGLRVRLRGPRGNATGLGAQVRLVFPARLGPIREVHGGSGYWSQDSVIQVLATPEAPSQIWARWPGGKITTRSIPGGAQEILVRFEE